MPSYTQVVLSPDSLYLQSKSYDAKADRKWFQDIGSEGVVGAGDFLVSWVSGLNISITAGAAWILGSNIADQGMYRQYVASATSMSVPVNTNANPRLDQVILRVLDFAADSNSGNLYESRIEIIPGTPTAGATLANRNGAANLTTLLESSKSLILLADLLVPGSSGNLSAGNIGDRRQYFSLKSASHLVTSAELTRLLSPVDGEEVTLVVDSSNGVNWRFRYNTGSASANKWEFVGGPPLYALVATDNSLANTGFVDLGTVGPSITLARAGDYMIEFGADCYQSAGPVADGNSQLGMSFAVGAVAAGGADSIDWAFSDLSNPKPGMRSVKKTSVVAGDAIVAKYTTRASDRTGHWFNRWMSITPIRIS